MRRLADRTPPERDRVVDTVRALSIAVVVIWHWSLSINHRGDDGRLVNPNPIADVPFGWAPTWVLQVMPLFFIVGGYANCAGWRSTRRDGGGARTFLTTRARRLFAPVAVFVVVWAALEATMHLLVDGHRLVLHTAPIVFIPLWFLAVYIGVVALVPVTARLHDDRPITTLVVLVTAIAVADVARLGLGVDHARWVNLVCVWVLVHQIGYFWADGTLTAWSRRTAAAVVAGGIAGLVALTSLGVYPRSLVATAETEISHMYPPTAVIPVLAVVQTGLVMLARPSLDTWLERSAGWTAVVGINAVIMTVFLWHMTALLGFFNVLEAVGVDARSEPTLGWWLARPVWILGPALLLVPLVAVFAPVETGQRDTG